MLKGTRHKDTEWVLPVIPGSDEVTEPDAALAVLMDIRDELKLQSKTLRSIRRAMPPRKPK